MQTISAMTTSAYMVWLH